MIIWMITHTYIRLSKLIIIKFDSHVLSVTSIKYMAKETHQYSAWMLMSKALSTFLVGTLCFFPLWIKVTQPVWPFGPVTSPAQPRPWLTCLASSSGSEGWSKVTSQTALWRHVILPRNVWSLPSTIYNQNSQVFGYRSSQSESVIFNRQTTLPALSDHSEDLTVLLGRSGWDNFRGI